MPVRCEVRKTAMHRVPCYSKIGTFVNHEVNYEQLFHDFHLLLGIFISSSATLVTRTALQQCNLQISLLTRVVTCGAIDSSYLHSVRSPSRPWQGASSVPNAGERRCYIYVPGATSRQVSPVGNPAPPITQSRSCAFLLNMVG